MRVSPILLLAPVLALAGAACVPTRPAPPPPPPRVVSLPPRALPPPVATNWLDGPVSAGTWRYSADARGSVAIFDAAGAGLASLRCDRQRGRVLLGGAGATPGPMTVHTSSVTRTVQTEATGEPPRVAATLTPTDPLLDAMAFSRGRFALSRPGAAPMVLPAWAEIGRVVEDCRQ